MMNRWMKLATVGLVGWLTLPVTGQEKELPRALELERAEQLQEIQQLREQVGSVAEHLEGILPDGQLKSKLDDQFVKGLKAAADRQEPPSRVKPVQELRRAEEQQRRQVGQRRDNVRPRDGDRPRDNLRPQDNDRPRGQVQRPAEGRADRPPQRFNGGPQPSSRPQMRSWGPDNQRDHHLERGSHPNERREMLRHVARQLEQLAAEIEHHQLYEQADRLREQANDFWHQARER